MSRDPEEKTYADELKRTQSQLHQRACWQPPQRIGVDCTVPGADSLAAPSQTKLSHEAHEPQWPQVHGRSLLRTEIFGPCHQRACLSDLK